MNNHHTMTINDKSRSAGCAVYILLYQVSYSFSKMIHETNITDSLNLEGNDIHTSHLSMAFSTENNATSIEKIVAEQLYLCPFTSLCYPFKWHNLRPSCCSSCSCESDCHLSGSCCPDRLQNVSLPEVIIERSKFQCISPQLKKGELSDVNGHPLMMISICSSHQYSDYLISRCDQSETIDVMRDVSVSIPVESAMTGQLFKNRYCALCNNITANDTVAWLPWVMCRYGITLPPFSVNNFLSYIKEARDCNIVYAAGENSKASVGRCPYGSITVCNQTGLWEIYDSLIDAACNAYASWYLEIYRNVFCYICNTNNREPNQTNCTKTIPGRGSLWRPSVFSALLNFNMETSDNVHTSPECEIGYILDHYQEICREVHCSSPNVYWKGNCSSLYSKATGLNFEFYIRIKPKNLNPEKPDIDRVYATLLQWWTDADIMSHSICNMTILETRHGWLLDNENYNLTLNQRNVTNPSLLVYLKIRLFGNSDIGRFTSSIADYDYDNLTFMTGTDHWAASLDDDYYDVDRLQSTWVVVFQRAVKKMMPILKCNNPIRITGLTNCPHIYLQSSEFYFRNDRALCLHNTEICFLEKKYVETDNGTLAFCISDYFFSPSSDKKMNSGDITQGWVSFVCTCVSIVCLLFTLVTYCLFHVLRTLPGKNNMALITYMIIAQLLFQFGMNETNYGSACIVIGVGIHFFWLLTMFSMNVCTIHMFRTFVRFTGMPLNAESQTRAFVLYCLYTIFMSSIFVVINIIFSILKSDQQEFGYRGVACYIKTRIMIALTFALPVGLVIVSNTIMYCIVVYRIHILPTMKTIVKQERNNFTIYIKLSSLTGVTWVSGFVYQWTGSIVFQYLFIIATCCQGVFIMLSFVCNKRVTQLYLSHCVRGYTYSDSTPKSTPNSEYLTQDKSTLETSNTILSIPQ